MIRLGKGAYINKILPVHVNYEVLDCWIEQKEKRIRGNSDPANTCTD